MPLWATRGVRIHDGDRGEIPRPQPSKRAQRRRRRLTPSAAAARVPPSLTAASSPLKLVCLLLLLAAGADEAQAGRAPLKPVLASEADHAWESRNRSAAGTS